VVGQSVGAIGYISLGFVDASVNAVSVDGVEPTEANVASRRYPIQRVLHMFTKGEPSGLAKQYIDFVLSTEVQDKIVRDAGFLPIGAEKP
jgi:phosphate transport system substrate-binding protein